MATETLDLSFKSLRRGTDESPFLDRCQDGVRSNCNNKRTFWLIHVRQTTNIQNILSHRRQSNTSLLRGAGLEWAQALITADGIRRDPQFSAAVGKLLWMVTVCVGMLVLLPSQMSIVDDFSRRWTDILWSGSRRVRGTLAANAVGRIYYAILSLYVLWTVAAAYLFSTYGTPKLMTLVIANLNNLAIGVTSFQLVWVNSTMLPAELRPRWYHRAGVLACGVFYLGMAALVFATKQWPMLVEMWTGWK